MFPNCETSQDKFMKIGNRLNSVLKSATINKIYRLCFDFSKNIKVFLVN